MKNILNNGFGAGRGWKVAIPITTVAAILGSVALLTSGREAGQPETDALRLANEELLGEKLNLQKRLAELEREHTAAHASVADAHQRILDLEGRLAAAQRAPHQGASNTPAANGRMKRELAAALDGQDRLRRELDAARDGQRTLQQQLDQLRADRDALVASMEQQLRSARMVNNAVVDAVRGKRQHLTVRARRTQEIRMAFDLPEEIAANASFRIISPSGRTHDGGAPSLSVIPDDPTDGATAARFMLASGMGTERAKRVHLKFKPEQRLEPGTYRIDIRSGDLYLNTVMLNLR